MYCQCCLGLVEVIQNELVRFSDVEGKSVRRNAARNFNLQMEDCNLKSSSELVLKARKINALSNCVNSHSSRSLG